MGRTVSLFSGYSQRENRVTNYSLLILKMIYEENPKYLGEILGAIVGEDISNHVGVSFRQQERQATTVPDGLIVQLPLTIFIETKNWDWFYDEQLEGHLSSLDNKSHGIKVLLALGNFEADRSDRFNELHTLCETQYKRSILFQAVTFEDFLNKLQLPGLSKNLLDAIADFKTFLNEENLLPSWKDWLDVVNCAGLPSDITEGQVYMCPASGGAYSHDRCRYFGMYRSKRVELVAEIEAVVDVDANSTTLKWNNISDADSDIKNRALTKANKLRPKERPLRVFLLGPLKETDFRKDTPGGMQGSKQYFNISHLGAKNASDLADRLKGRCWSDMKVQG